MAPRRKAAGAALLHGLLCTASASASAAAKARTGAAGEPPLSVWWSAANSDNYVVGTPAGRADAKQRGYTLDSNGDGVSMPKAASSIALTTWWSASAHSGEHTSHEAFMIACFIP